MGKSSTLAASTRQEKLNDPLLLRRSLPLAHLAGLRGQKRPTGPERPMKDSFLLGAIILSFFGAVGLLAYSLINKDED